MSINSTNRPPTAVVASREIAGSGNRNDKSVHKTKESLNSFSPNIQSLSLRSRSARTPTSSERRGVFDTLRLCFGRQRQSDNRQISSPMSHIGRDDKAQARAHAKGKACFAMDAALRGIAGAKGRSVEGLVGERSSEEVKSFLNSSDKGIRRGTTAIDNLSKIISFENLSDEERQKMPAASKDTLEQQSTRIRGMARTICDATYHDGKYAFSQFGDNNKGYTEIIEKHPEQDQTMRAWIQDGLNLGSELMNTQVEVLFNGRAQSASYLDALQSRVNTFASIERDLFAPTDKNSEMEGLADEVIKKTHTE